MKKKIVLVTSLILLIILIMILSLSISASAFSIRDIINKILGIPYSGPGKQQKDLNT